jgi:flagellar hook-associated protein 1 FlgK
MSGFSTLNTAISGLAAATRALDVTGQNIVNATTPGYSRQLVRLASVGATTAATFHTGNDQSVIGGVMVERVERIRNTFLESMRVAAGSSMTALEAQTSALQGVEQLLAEPGDNGLQAIIDDFYSAWQDLAQRPGDEGAGAVVIQRGHTVVAQLKFVASGIAERWNTSRDDLSNTIAEANQAAQDLAKVNAKIREGSITDRPVNELLDQRDQLVRQLGELVGARAVGDKENMVSVTINGMSLVAGAHAEELTLSGATNLGTVLTDPPRMTFGGLDVNASGGRAAGLVAALRTDLPTVALQLDGVANSLRDVVNTVHGTGFTLSGESGGDFFTGSGAGGLGVAPTSIADLAVARTAGVVDGGNALTMADLAIDSNAEGVLGSSSPSQLWRNLTANVGTQLQGMQRAIDVQESVVATADAAVESDSGVNLDEEMSALLMYQRAFEASARVITVVDEMLDTLVNRLGTIGR